jgi:lysophospholipase L1-like esterase
MQTEAPGATIILTGILPRNGSDGSTSLIPVINKINARMAALADGNSIRYLNINEGLADANGKLFEGMAVDGLHLDTKGFQVWADALKPIFTELLGPPAAVDRSPPPSTNPAAR